MSTPARTRLSAPLAPAIVIAAIIAVLATTFSGFALPAHADGGDDAPASAPVEATPSATLTPSPSAEPEPTEPEPAETPSPSAVPDATPVLDDEPGDGPSITLSQQYDLVEGQQIVVTGTGFGPDAPSTTATRPPLAGSFGGVYVALGRYPDTWKPSDGAPSSARKNMDVAWVLSPENVATVGGSAAGAVAINPDGSFEVTLTVDSWFADNPGTGNYGVYTYPGGGAPAPQFETYTPITIQPSIRVSQTDDLVDGSTVTVRGHNFLPNPPLTTHPDRAPLPGGKFAGVYVAFGRYPDVWQPSLNVSASARKNAATRWVVSPEDVAAIGGEAAGGVAIEPDGEFTTTLALDSFWAQNPGSGNYGIYTYGGGGTKVPAFETYTPLDFLPAVRVSQTEDLDDVQQVTVEGHHFEPDAPGTNGTRPPLAGKFAGIYVNFGRYPDEWQPSEGVTMGARKNGSSAWVVYPEDVETIGGTAAGAVAINPDHSFTVTLDVDKDYADNPGSGTYGIYTFSGSGATYAPFETATPLTFASDGASVDPEPEPEPTPEPSAPAVPVGSLTWGFDADFRAYITGATARGSITSSGASYSGGQFTFIQSGGSVDTAAGTGTATYGGSVRFTGHHGALDLTFASPQVRLTGPSSAVLSYIVNGKRADIASLNLAAATRTDNSGAVRFSGVPAVLTGAGANAFEGFYPAGRVLDPVTVTFGAGTTATGGGGSTISFKEPVKTAIPDTPPATEGIVLDDASLEALLAGGVVTIAAEGFEPGELVKIVIYSTPTLLGTATADANGVATWKGSLPAGLTGTHTLVFIGGSTAKGIVLNIPESNALALCVAQDATLTWGFKESFRAYLDSTIAHGEWIVSEDVVDDRGIFTWSDGVASLDEGPVGTVSFIGSLRFTGHEGVLDTTLFNPVIEFAADGTYLVLDIEGDTQSGVAVSARGVRFATLDLAAATVREVGGTVVLEDIPATLTEGGSEAFGTYPAGEAMDPVTLSIGGDCALSVFGLADAPAPSVEPTPSAEPQDDTPAAAGDQGGPSWLPWLLVGVLALALVVTIVQLRRRPQA